MMLAGLLFALHDADDRPDRLAATLPFGGVTLIEYQARLLIAAGAAQIIIVVSRLTPELLGAVNRIGRRGVAVDAIRSATEAVEKLHPLARIVMLADGLITTESIVAMLADEGADALLVVPEGEGAAGFERVGGQMAWAGIARLDPRRMQEVASLPRDYDLQSSLLRAASQARATHILLPPAALRQGHGIEHQAQALEARGRGVLAAIVSDRRGWFDRFVVAPVARVVLPRLVARGVSAAAVGGAAGALGLAGLVTVALGFAGPGLALALLAGGGLSLGTTLADLRDDDVLARVQSAAAAAIAGLAVLLLGRGIAAQAAGGTALTAALVLVVLATLAERAIPARSRRLWWGSPPAYLLVVFGCVLLGLAQAGLFAGAAYATATLAVAIEALRRPQS